MELCAMKARIFLRPSSFSSSYSPSNVTQPWQHLPEQSLCSGADLTCKSNRVKLIHSQINIVTLICIGALHNQIYKLQQICPIYLGISWMYFF